MDRVASELQIEVVVLRHRPEHGAKVVLNYYQQKDPADELAKEIKKAGGTVVGSTGIPLNTADMTPPLRTLTIMARRRTQQLRAK